MRKYQDGTVSARLIPPGTRTPLGICARGVHSSSCLWDNSNQGGRDHWAAPSPSCCSGIRAGRRDMQMRWSNRPADCRNLGRSRSANLKPEGSNLQAGKPRIRHLDGPDSLLQSD
eukprot:2491185-Rhodomonas_salina.5